MVPACSRLHRFGDALWFVLFAGISSWWCLSSAREIGATFDEPVYIREGLDHWRSGSYRGLLRMGTMPLPIDVQTLPLFWWEQTRETPFDARNDLSELLPWARAGTLWFWWLLLFYARLIGRDLGGAWAGRLAVALVALEPNFLAHASLATTDIASTAMLVMFAYHFARGRAFAWRWRIGLPALVFGFAILAKASALAFGPLIMLGIELTRWARGRYGSDHTQTDARAVITPPARRSWLHAFRPFIKDSLQIGLLGLAITFLYCGSDWKPQSSFVEWAGQLPEGTGKNALVWVADSLRIFPNAGEALIRQIRHNFQGHGVYILGHTAPRSVWYYFPVALSIKLSLPLLVLPLLLLVSGPRRLVNWACVAAGILLLYSLNCKVQIGIRFMLPLMALAAAGLAAATWQAIQDARSSGRGFLGGACLTGLVWMAWSSWHVWPHGLAYANELWGGSEQLALRLSDSNCDWGQGLPELAAWQHQHDTGAMAIWYFGTDPAVKEMAVGTTRYHEKPHLAPSEFLDLVRGRWVAVSATFLYGAYLPHQTELISYLQSQRPAARTTTFFIFDFRELASINPRGQDTATEKSGPRRGW